MSTDTPEAPLTGPAGEPTPTPDSVPDHAPDHAPDVGPATPETPTEPQPGTPDLSGLGTHLPDPAPAPAETGTDPQTDLTPQERAEAHLAEHQSAPADEPVPTEVGGQTVDLTHDQVVALRSLPNAATATDAQGVERIVVPDLNADGWTPNPVEPDPGEVARIEAMQAALDAKKAERLDAMQVKP